MSNNPLSKLLKQNSKPSSKKKAAIKSPKKPRASTKTASAMIKTPPAKPQANKTNKKAVATNNASKIPALAVTSRTSEKDRNLIDDTVWLFFLVVTAYLALCLISFSMKDPSWSRNSPNSGSIHNFGGLLGSYIADIFYYLFGMSAWWLIIAMGVWLYRNFRPILASGKPPYNALIGGVGLGFLLLCSPVLETFAFGISLDKSFPLGAGGLVGSLIASGLSKMLGVTGSVLIFFIISMLAFSLLIQISWLDFLENLGNKLESLFKYLFRKRNSEEDVFVEEAYEPKIIQPKSVAVAENIIAEPIEHKPSGSTSNRKIDITVAQPIIAKSNREKVAEQSQPENQSELQPEIPEYQLPTLSSLNEPKAVASSEIDKAKLEETAKYIEERLADFGIEVKVVSATAGPVITRYEIEPARGVKGSQIVNLSKDLARALTVQSVRVVETIAGKNTMGIELPNENRQDVLLQEIFASDAFTESQSKLSVALGKDIAGAAMVGDLAKMPHLLVGGMTGSGKSVGVNAMILSMLYKAKPDEVRFIMIDPKMLELSVYEGIPHLLCPVVTDMKAAGNALNWCVAEMEKRYRLLSHVGVRNLVGYNEKIQAAKLAEKPIPNPFSLNPDEPEPLEKLPQIVVVIDELADLMMTEKKAVETQIARLAQKARAAGIHMIIATQRPSVDVITGLIKANVPTRMAFTVQSRIDSRTILDQMGAEDLLKYGDLLFLQPGEAEPTRLQGAFVNDDEVHRVVSFIKAQAEPNYEEGILSGEATLATNQFINPEASNGGDELFDQAVQFVVSSRKTSISALQRHLRIGYNRAANLMQALEDGGIVSPAETDGKRQIFARGEM
ncbi:DNA translocase FtsK 4TM domain-containing protein [Kingella negevensis]|uniref:DNA translocase FtsK n=1 Tax=Kingella negevensis TaxID=1522312 RepID=A0A238TCL8_9NEIS|nr:DNA translocase FtsK 4TM domain-containing protein [Kingella negevensis]SNB67390.1 DNA translocase FtsK [Kingella negevensis]